MKKAFLLIALMLFATFIFATIEEYYSFNYYTGTYTPISGTPVPNISQSKISDIISLPFPFPYGSYLYREVQVSYGGCIGLGHSKSTSIPFINLTYYAPLIAPFWDSFYTNNNSDFQYLICDEAIDRHIVIQYSSMYWNDCIVNFQAYLYESGKIEFHYGPSTGIPYYPRGSIGINMLPGGPGWFYNVIPTSEPIITTNYDNGNVSHFPQCNTVYEFNPVIAHANDLTTFLIESFTTPAVGQSSDFIITVYNRGANSQNNYEVKLFLNDDIEIGSVKGSLINTLETLEFVISWTPAITGHYSLYAKVLLNNDEYIENNQSPPLEVEVYPEGTVFTTVGKMQRYGQMPLLFTYQRSIFECIYPADKIHCWGLITGIQFYYNSNRTISNNEIRVWLGETTQINLSNNWIPSTQLTKVFDGFLSFSAGQNIFYINFDIPYTYAGENLIVMMERSNLFPDPYENSSWQFYFEVQESNIENCARIIEFSDLQHNASNPPDVSPVSIFPVTTFKFMTTGFGPVLGKVHDSNNMPIVSAEVSFSGSSFIATTNAAGFFQFPFLLEGTHQIKVSKYGYYDNIQDITIGAHQFLITDFTLLPLALVSIRGMVVGNDQSDGGLAGATVNFSGYANYTTLTDMNGQFTINNVYSDHIYDYVVQKNGYRNATGEVNVGNTDLFLSALVLNVIAFTPQQVQAIQASDSSYVSISWLSPIQYLPELEESFEGDIFPPPEWLQFINNAVQINNYGVSTTWGKVGMVHSYPPIIPHSGSYQVGIVPSQSDQNEWLITPQFTCPENAILTFWSYVFLGDQGEGGCNLMISTNNGNGWLSIWNAKSKYGGLNNYEKPITVNLSNYSGRQIRLAWIYSSPQEYGWFLDDITVSNSSIVLKFPLESIKTSDINSSTIIKPDFPESLSNAKDNERILIGYQIWRLPYGTENNPENWTLLTETPIPELSYQDNSWNSIPDDIYRWAVRSVYTNNIQSNPVFSNALSHGFQAGVISGRVISGTLYYSFPVFKATIFCGSNSTTTDVAGYYNLIVPSGTYNVSASAPMCLSQTINNVNVNPNQITEVNFILPYGSYSSVDNFESYEDFALIFEPSAESYILRTIDLDHSPTCTLEGVNWPNAGLPMAFMVFNPFATIPPLSGALPFSGYKEAACFGSVNNPNNDWLIAYSPSNVGFQFWARSYSPDNLARFKVGISWTDNNPSNFTIISGENYIEAPYVWTNYSYNTEAPYYGIQCVSENGAILFVDDLQKGFVTIDDPIATPSASEILGNYPNPFNPETTIRFSVKETSSVILEIYNQKGQYINTLVNETKTPGNYSVIWNGKDYNNRAVSSGIYICRLKVGKNISTRKMLLMK